MRTPLALLRPTVFLRRLGAQLALVALLAVALLPDTPATIAVASFAAPRPVASELVPTSVAQARMPAARGPPSPLA